MNSKTRMTTVPTLRAGGGQNKTGEVYTPINHNNVNEYLKSNDRPLRSVGINAKEPLIIHDGIRLVTIGEYDNSRGIFTKSIKAKHILRIPPAIAIQESAIQTLKSKNCKLIRVTVSDGRKLHTSFDNFLEKGFLFDRGYGKQFALSLDLWTDSSKPTQGSLFGGCF